MLDGLCTLAHRTAGSAGLYAFERVSVAAAQLEDAVIAHGAGKATPERIDANIEALLFSIGREQTTTSR